MSRASRRLAALLVIATCAGGLAVPADAVPRPAHAGCDGIEPITVLYINGIANDEANATDSASALRSLIESNDVVGTSGDVEVGHLYNPTAGILTDLVEVLEQRLEDAIDAKILSARQLADIVAELAGLGVGGATLPIRVVARLVATLPVDVVRRAGDRPRSC